MNSIPNIFGQFFLLPYFEISGGEMLGFFFYVELHFPLYFDFGKPKKHEYSSVK